jgi:hypothetical protein
VINLSQAQDAILEKVQDLIMVIRKTQMEQLVREAEQLPLSL